MGYLYLTIAIVSEVVATSALKSTEEFTRFWPSVLVVVGYCASIYFLALVLRSMPVGIAYAIWAGVGVAAIVAVGAIVLKEVPDWPAIIGMVLIVSGVVVINLFSTTSSH